MQEDWKQDHPWKRNTWLLYVLQKENPTHTSLWNSAQHLEVSISLSFWKAFTKWGEVRTNNLHQRKEKPLQPRRCLFQRQKQCKSVKTEGKNTHTHIYIPAQDLMVWIFRSNTTMLIKCVISPANLKIFILPDTPHFSKTQRKKRSGFLQLMSKSICLLLLLLLLLLPLPPPFPCFYSFGILVLPKMHSTKSTP